MSHVLRLFPVTVAISAAFAAGGFAADESGPQLPLPGDADVEQTKGAAEPGPLSAGAAPGPFAWSQLLRELAEETIPRDLEQREGWGDQTEVVTGVRIREKHGLPRISKRTKRVNHGVWRRYQVALHRPEETLRFAIQDVRAREGDGLTFKVCVSARVRCTAQSEFWNFGVRTGSATVRADATLRVVARFSVRGRAVSPDDGGWLVEVEYAPEVERVRIELDDFDVRRLGHLDGDLADGLGNLAQGVLAEVLQSQENKVARRIRRELVERDARVRLTVPRVLWDGPRIQPD